MMNGTIGIIGGTGPAGRGVAVRLAKAGYAVSIGSRDAARASEVVRAMAVPTEGSIRGVANDDAATADVVIVATPWDSAVATVKALREQLANKVVISMVNALVREGRELIPVYPSRGSMANQLASTLPSSRIVGAFHHLPAAQMEDLESGLDADVVIFGDDAPARELVEGLVNEMPGLRGVVAGTMSLAGAVEAFTAVCVSINIRHKAHSYVKLEGLTN